MATYDPTLQRDFDWQSFSLALAQLDSRIPSSPILSQFLPIRVVASGGYVSLCALGNRTTTQDLDYFIDPLEYGPLNNQVQAEIRRLILDVARKMHFVPDWANDQVMLFLSLLRDPKDLFDRSIQQGVVLYNGINLQIYAVLWLWVLVRKMKRLQMEGLPPREVDWSDCVFITHQIIQDTGGPVRKTSLQEFDHTDREPPIFAETVHLVNQRVQQMYGVDGFAD